ncbi:Major Facilitator Superfamily protein [Hymenobacter gelipurpurascens]|uniref:Major Facilitator Superfamily protein n=1 Tax=Hymenobacter gelipurpurascens TaxID=89968 RepID=A0A212THX8_9BACT|nr:MFS transporter [Hymenobacter gelipurpurascens]SNC65426.1 Major Facilitator Superfamily protein [Hymenobacter gelipurpurascens]
MKQAEPLPLFKAWVPEWAIRAVLFWALLPPFLLLGLYAGSGAEVAAYYGVEPADVQFSILLFYAGLVAFLPFDPHLGSYLRLRNYLLVSVVLLAGLVGLAGWVRDFRLLLVLRFLQGTVACTIVTPLLTLIFSRLHTTRARAMGYAVFYGGLLASAPLGTMLSWTVLDRYPVPALFHAFLLLAVPGALLLLLILNGVRTRRRLPLTQLEWPSWVLLATMLLGMAYLASYGQLRYWLESPEAWLALGLSVVGGGAFGWRQWHLKRPYIHLGVFRYRTFCVGLVLFMAFYFFRGTTNISASYFTGVLHVNAHQMVELQAATLVGIVLGVSVVVRFVLLGTPLRRLLVVGFALLLAHHVWMYLLFGPAQGLAVFRLPLLLQGVAVGFVLVPLALFTMGGLPPQLASAGTFAAVAFRNLGFVGSLAVTSVLQPYWRTAQLDRFRADLLPGTSLVAARMQVLQHTLQGRGLDVETGQRGAASLLSRTLETQTLLRYCLNYFGLVSLGITALLVVLLVLPPLHWQAVTFRQRPL